MRGRGERRRGARARGARRTGPKAVGALAGGLAVLFIGAAGFPQERADFEYEDADRVDSLRARLSSGRLAELRRLAFEEDGPRRWYDLGAALLVSGDWEGAVEPLEQAVAAGESGVAGDASYNLGLAHAIGSRPRSADDGAGPPAEVLRAGLLRARESLRRVLREDPEASDARWNLEVVEGWLEQLGGGGGDEGGGGQGGEEPSEGAGRSELAPDEVQRLLETAASEERRVQAERFDRSRARDPVAERNW